MNKSKNIMCRIVIALVISVCMLANPMPASANGSGVIFDSSKTKIITHSYKEFNKKETVEFSYSDEMLLSDARILSGDIAKLAVNLSLLAYSDYQIGRIADNTDFGYSFKLYNYGNNWSYEDNDYVAFSIANKTIEKNGKTYNAYLVPIRGTSGREWYSNFKIGSRSDGYHEGFKIAADRVLETIRKEVKTDNNIFLITGHSRGGAVANIVAAELTRDADLATAGSIFGYSFACPAVKQIVTGNYRNIRNYNNPGDSISALPLRDWGFERYGEDIYISISDDAYNAFRTRYEEINGSPYDGAADIAAFETSVKNQIPDPEAYNNSDNAFMLDVAAAVLARLSASELPAELSKIAKKHNKNILQVMSLNPELAELFMSTASENSHKPTTYVLLINSKYYGYKGRYAGTASTDTLTLTGTSVIDSKSLENASGIQNIEIKPDVAQIGEAALLTLDNLDKVVIEGPETQIFDDATTINANAVIVAHDNSIAAEYAKKYGRAFESLCEESWNSGEITTSPTCSEDGVRTYTCLVCGKEKTEAIDKLGHVEVKIPAVEPTPTSPGLTEGAKCSACGEILRAQEEIPALGEEHESFEYSWTYGADTVWTKGSSAAAEFRVVRDKHDEETFAKFRELKVDDAAVGTDCYETSAGSVIIKLLPTYLETLSAGKHTLEVVMADGGVKTTLTIKAAAPELPEWDDMDDGSSTITPIDSNNPDDSSATIAPIDLEGTYGPADPNNPDDSSATIAPVDPEGTYGPADPNKPEESSTTTQTSRGVKTGDEAVAWIWLLLLVAATVVVTVISIRRQRA